MATAVTGQDKEVNKGAFEVVVASCLGIEDGLGMEGGVTVDRLAGRGGKAVFVEEAGIFLCLRVGDPCGEQSLSESEVI